MTISTEEEPVSVTAPVESEQRRRARAQANERRIDAAEVRQRVRSSGRLGARIVADILDNPPAYLASRYVWQLLRWVPAVGDTTAARMLGLSDIDPWRKVGRLTPRMRVELAAQLRSHADGLGLVRPPRPPSMPAVPAPAAEVEAPVPSSDPLVCRACSNPMQRVSRSGVCGLCIAEALAGRGPARR